LSPTVFFSFFFFFFFLFFIFLFFFYFFLVGCTKPREFALPGLALSIGTLSAGAYSSMASPPDEAREEVILELITLLIKSGLFPHDAGQNRLFGQNNTSGPTRLQTLAWEEGDLKIRWAALLLMAKHGNVYVPTLEKQSASRKRKNRSWASVVRRADPP